MAKPDILIVDGHPLAGNAYAICDASRWRRGRRAKRDNTRFSHFRPITGHAPSARHPGAICNRACSKIRRAAHERRGDGRLGGRFSLCLASVTV
jgi:hypothetical protein